jgi:photosystem II biogenesis protein Psp29
MVEMHLLAVNTDYRYDPIYALGIDTSFDRFMQGYRPDSDKPSIFDGLCKALQDDPNLYRQDAERMRTFASSMSAKDLVSWFEQAATVPYGDDLQERIKAIANNPNFKYSRLFAIGLFSLFEIADPEAIKNEAQREELLKQVCTALRLPQDKVQKDLELYRSNLEKMTQAQAVMKDILEADKKKREQRSQPNSDSPAVESSDPSKDEAASGS